VCVSDLYSVVTSCVCVSSQEIESPIQTPSIVTHTRDNNITLKSTIFLDATTCIPIVQRGLAGTYCFLLQG
jgi:hypothetical protein